MPVLWDHEAHGDAVMPASSPFVRPAALRVGVPVGFRIDNIEHIESAYGAGVAQEVLSCIHSALRRHLSSIGVANLTGGRFEVMIAQPATPDDDRFSADCTPQLADTIGALCDDLAWTPVHTSAGPVHVWLSGACRPGASGALVPASEAPNAPFCGAAVGRKEGWASQYRDDMRIVASCLASLTQHSHTSDDVIVLPARLAWQAVCDARDPSWKLYHEALLRGTGVDGRPISVGATVLALERLGFARLLDLQVVGIVLGELEAAPDVVLGVNISAQSAVMDRRWTAIENRLRRDPELASRLVIEITETAAFQDLGQAVRFASRMQRLGCRIAIDDFGTGHASIRQLLALSPSIVKIDRFFLRRASLSDAGRATFGHLAGLARAMGATVIVEGSESSLDAQVALEAGVEWQQGYYYGQPSLYRTWKSSRHVHADNTVHYAIPGPVPLHATGRA